MAVITPLTTKRNVFVNTFEVKGEEFVVLKRDYLDELILLMKSYITGEKALKEGKTRSFSDFLKAISKKKK